jgi:8-oxo-dGTP pyrophosphatase MutT (NUDIX family)
MILHRLFSRLYLFLSRFRRGMTLGVRAAVFDGDGRVFLVKHSYAPGWYLPGGGVDRGETMEEALARELVEEGGIRLAGRARLFGVYLQRRVSARDHVALYICRDWTRPAPPKLPNFEIVDCGFFAPDALPEGVTEGTRRRLAEIAEGRAPAAEW